MRHDYLKSKSANDKIYIIDARVDIKNKKLFCGYLDIEYISPENKVSTLVSESLMEYSVDTDFSDGEIKYPCNQFNVTLNLI